MLMRQAEESSPHSQEARREKLTSSMAYDENDRAFTLLSALGLGKGVGLIVGSVSNRLGEAAAKTQCERDKEPYSLLIGVSLVLVSFPGVLYAFRGVKLVRRIQSCLVFCVISLVLCEFFFVNNVFKASCAVVEGSAEQDSDATRMGLPWQSGAFLPAHFDSFKLAHVKCAQDWDNEFCRELAHELCAEHWCNDRGDMACQICGQLLSQIKYKDLNATSGWAQ